ncbi:hypothetical protein BKA67DRAFT_595581 [Truncatella angustata]|uniref:Rhodopsin domain-containing protein n=1 Tax=Truncatella angustata TaxID=152316 RepID=A0A9P8RHS8_9PEZI|nr:uncharacterized protein BKA67DRAFT_595581 [Truncatella angustata]KAH6646269.1 hypothetical protein BKA67DRAFT_595581 [Truncatella angustata]
MAEFPITNGVTTVIGPPAGYKVNFLHPRQQHAVAHYLIFGLMGSLAFTALFQRLYTKMHLSTGLRIDDGRMPITVYENHMLSSYVSAPCFILCNGFTKMSLLAFYLNISPHKWFKWSIWATFSMVVCYTIAITCMLLFGCSPTRAMWDLYTKGTCLNASVLYMAIAVSNIVSDIILFLIPIRTVINLKMGIVQKIGAITLFGIASITVTTSTLRLSYLPSLLPTNDIPCLLSLTSDFLHWFLEVILFIICGSMPTLRKFFKHFGPKLIGSSGDNSKALPSAHDASQRKFGHPSRNQYEKFDEMEMSILNRMRENKSESERTTTKATATTK